MLPPGQIRELATLAFKPLRRANVPNHVIGVVPQGHPDWLPWMDKPQRVFEARVAYARKNGLRWDDATVNRNAARRVLKRLGILDETRHQYEEYEAYLRKRRTIDDEQGREWADIIITDPCSYCGGEANTIDHITPLAHGGTNQWENLAAACRPCNSRKGTRSMLWFLRRAA